MTPARQRGFTLVELLIALSIVGALLVIAFGGLRMGFAAWRQGEARAGHLEQARGLTQLLTQALSGTHPYRTEATGVVSPRLLFEGEPDRVALVTVTPPIPAAAPIAFTAVTLEAGDGSGLVLRQKVLPNSKPFERTGTPTLTEPTVAGVRFRYWRETTAVWEDRWNAEREKALPGAVEITLTTLSQGRPVEQPPFVVPIHATAP